MLEWIPHNIIVYVCALTWLAARQLQTEHRAEKSQPSGWLDGISPGVPRGCAAGRPYMFLPTPPKVMGGYTRLVAGEMDKGREGEKER